MGARAQEHVLRQFPVARLLEDVERLYDELLTRSRFGCVQPPPWRA
jgi:hypothetical protein